MSNKSYVYRAFQALIISNIFLLPNLFIHTYTTEFTDSSGSVHCRIDEYQEVHCESEGVTEIINCNQHEWCKENFEVFYASTIINLCTIMAFFVLIWFTCETYCTKCVIECCYPLECETTGIRIFLAIKPIFLILIIFFIITAQQNCRLNDKNIIVYALKPTLVWLGFIALIDATLIFIYNQLCCCIKK